MHELVIDMVPVGMEAVKGRYAQTEPHVWVQQQPQRLCDQEEVYYIYQRARKTSPNHIYWWVGDAASMGLGGWRGRGGLRACIGRQSSAQQQVDHGGWPPGAPPPPLPSCERLQWEHCTRWVVGATAGRRVHCEGEQHWVPTAECRVRRHPPTPAATSNPTTTTGRAGRRARRCRAARAHDAVP